MMADTAAAMFVHHGGGGWPGSREALVTPPTSPEPPPSPEEGRRRSMIPPSSSPPPSYIPVFLPRTNFATCTCSSSLPPSLEEHSSVYGGDKAEYGSLPGDMSSSEKVTYCIHGKPSGCCAKVVSGPSNKNLSKITIDHCHKEQMLGVNKKARKKLIIASVLCLVFMVAEFIGGYFSGSLAIATDAAHLLTDFAAFMISLLSLWVSARKPSRLMPFGWHRAEVIGATVSVLTIWLVTGILVYMAIQRIITGEYEINAVIMLITSGIGVLVNLIMGMTLHQHGHSHTAITNNPVTGEPVREKQNINVRAAYIHVLGDLLQSVGVFIAAIAIYFKPTWGIIDPICTFIFSVFVLLTTITILRDALIVLMEGMPRDLDFNEVLATLMAIDGVIRVHNLRIWALNLEKTALSAHLAIAPGVNSIEILKTATQEIHKKYNFFEMTLQIEYFNQNMENCDQCKIPS